MYFAFGTMLRRTFQSQGNNYNSAVKKTFKSLIHLKHFSIRNEVGRGLFLFLLNGLASCSMNIP